MTRTPAVKRNSGCGRRSLIGIGSENTTISSLLCKSWSCDFCRPRLTSKWSNTVYATEQQGIWSPTVFLTITLDPSHFEKKCKCVACQSLRSGKKFKGKRPNKCLLLDYRVQSEFLRKAWTRLIARLRRIYGFCQYVRVWEYHSGGWDSKRKINNWRLHLHALLDCDAPAGGYTPDGLIAANKSVASLYSSERDVYAKWAKELGLGISKALYVPSEAVRGYITKYMGKRKPSVYRWRVRLVGCSRKIKHSKNKSEGEWFVLGAHGSYANAKITGIGAEGGLVQAISRTLEKKGVQIEGIGRGKMRVLRVLSCDFDRIFSGKLRFIKSGWAIIWAGWFDSSRCLDESG